jgi:hypothetical protein
MSITVRQLIAQLKKLPQSAKVAVIAHDQDAERGEFDGFVRSAGEAPAAIKERGCGVIINL